MRSSRLFLLSLLALLCLCSSRSWSAESNAAPAPGSRPEATNSQNPLQSYSQLQEQLHATQLAIEQTRKETGEAAARSAQALTAIEQALALQRMREMEVAQSSNRSVLILAGILGLLGFAALLLMAYFQWRTVNRLADVSMALLTSRSLPPGATVSDLGVGEGRLLSTGRPEQASQRLLGAVERLESRIHELEHSARPALKAASNGQSHPNALPGATNGKAEPAVVSNGAAAPAPKRAPEAEAIDWFAKGQGLLDQNQAAAALECFDQVLQVAPAHNEALVKKGLALERLQRMHEALACYDRAIAAEPNLTLAYLHKGGLCNRIGRSNEALACYELALRTQEKRAG